MACKFSRRALLAGMALSACGHKRASRYPGWLFVAGRAEKSVAVADLAYFRRLTAISLDHAPEQLFHAGGKVFATCPDGQALVAIDPHNPRVVGRIGLPAKPIVARLMPDGVTAIVLAGEPNLLLAVDLSKGSVIGRLPLPAPAPDLDLNQGQAAITLPERNATAQIDLARLKMTGTTDVGVPCVALRFRRDGKTILAAAPTAREIISIDCTTGKLLARMPVPIAPMRFCFNRDGGQMFVTGVGQDVVAIVSPFQNEVDQTVLAGRTPFAMAVSDERNLLFVTNLEGGDLTILDIESRGRVASVHVGESPGDVLLTPDGQYALVVDGRTGNVSVVRIPTVLDHDPGALGKVRAKPLFTIFPTAADARSAIIVPFDV